MPNKKLAKTYPYPILSFQLDASEEFSQPNPLCVNIFFLGEALLRSEKVIEAYGQGDEAFRACLEHLGLRYNPLAGEHHTVMRMDTTIGMQQNEYTSAGFVDDGILDLKAYARFKPSDLHRTGGIKDSLRLLLDPDPRYLCLRLDAACTPTALIKRLRGHLTQRHEQVKDAPLSGPFAGYYRAFNTPFHKISTWLDYLRCYDLDWNGIPDKQIADQIFGVDDVDGLNKAGKAVRRVKKVIRSAGKGIWPPPDVN